MGRYHFLLFDLDGTLTDPKQGICRSVQYALEKMGIIEENLDALEPFIGPPLVDSFCEFYHMTKEEALLAVEKYRERFSRIGLFENEVYPGIPKLLSECQNKGMHLAVASSKPEIYVRQILEHFDLAKYFDVIVGSELDGRRVQKEEVVEEALRQLRELSQEALGHDNAAMIGDRRFDVEGAKAHGLTGIGVRFGYAPEGELEQAGADFIAETVKDLRDYLL